MKQTHTHTHTHTHTLTRGLHTIKLSQRTSLISHTHLETVPCRFIAVTVVVRVWPRCVRCRVCHQRYRSWSSSTHSAGRPLAISSKDGTRAAMLNHRQRTTTSALVPATIHRIHRLEKSETHESQACLLKNYYNYLKKKTGANLQNLNRTPRTR